MRSLEAPEVRNVYSNRPTRSQKCASEISPSSAMHGERSADFQSAVSQVFNLLKPRQGCRPDFESCMRIGRSADYKSAIQQIENLRYVCGKPETLQMRPRKAPAGRND